MSSVVFLKLAAVSSRSLLITALPRPKTTAMMARRCKHTVKDRDDHDHDHSAPSSHLGPSASAKTNIQEKSAELVRARVPKVMLLGLDNNQIGLMPFANAQHLAKQKGLKLLQVPEDSQHQEQRVYRLITGVQLHEERQKERVELKAAADGTALVSKSVKTMIVGARIQKHDLQARVRTIQRWLTKGHVVRLTINGDDKSACNLENIYSDLEKAADEVGGQALQKRKDEENFTIKFTLQLSKKKVAAMQHKRADSEAAKEPKEQT